MLGDFFERQETMAVFAVIHKAGFQRRLNAGDHGLVDVALALLAPFDFNFVVEEFLSIDDGQAAFFSLRGVDQHPFHDAFPSCSVSLESCDSSSHARYEQTRPELTS
jgi:hypothetical protein